MSATDHPHSPRDPDAIDLPRDIDPPPDLEDRIVARLSHAGLLRRRSRTMWMAVAAGAAACFAAGVLTAGAMAPRRPAPSNEPRYMLLLYGGEAGTTSSIDRDASARAHIAWLASLRQQGRTISGERLSQSREFVGFASGAPPNPPLEGFFVVVGDSLADAVRVARSSPHVAEGGRIVVQAIDTP